MKFAMLLNGDEAEFNQASPEELDAGLKEVCGRCEWNSAAWPQCGQVTEAPS